LHNSFVLSFTLLLHPHHAHQCSGVLNAGTLLLVTLHYFQINPESLLWIQEPRVVVESVLKKLISWSATFKSR